MKTTIAYIILTAVVLMQTACEENDRLDYSADARVYFNEQVLSGAVYEEVSTKSYTFADKASTVTQDTVYVTAEIMGYRADTDRTFKAEVVSDSSATAASDGTTYYQVLDGVVKAGEVAGYLPIVLYRTELIKDTTLQITLQLVEAAGYDLVPGVAEKLTFSVYWADRLIKPGNWDTMLFYFFGAYSQTKYQFIIDVLGISEFSVYSRFDTSGQYTLAQMYDFVAQLNEALQTYNDAHDPDLTDEDGEPVTFP